MPGREAQSLKSVGFKDAKQLFPNNLLSDPPGLVPNLGGAGAGTARALQRPASRPPPHPPPRSLSQTVETRFRSQKSKVIPKLKGVQFARSPDTHSSARQTTPGNSHRLPTAPGWGSGVARAPGQRDPPATRSATQPHFDFFLKKSTDMFPKKRFLLPGKHSPACFTGGGPGTRVGGSGAFLKVTRVQNGPGRAPGPRPLHALSRQPTRARLHSCLHEPRGTRRKRKPCPPLSVTSGLPTARPPPGR